MGGFRLVGKGRICWTHLLDASLCMAALYEIGARAAPGGKSRNRDAANGAPGFPFSILPAQPQQALLGDRGH